ncbi:MAG: ABC transporter permease [Jiangellaceae bacterium]
MDRPRLPLPRPFAHRAVSPARPRGRGRFRGRSWLWEVVVLGVALLIAAPILVVVASVFTPAGEIWTHLASTVLPEYVRNSLLLMLGVMVGTLVLGVGGAWLITMTTFPGRRVAEWALLLPLAIPAYILAYAYTDFLQFSGPLQTWLREVTGWSGRDYWFPTIRSLPGAVAMLTLALYPYVYLLTRTAFLEQSNSMLEATRSLGRGPWQGFVRVSLPLARPAIAAGTALALMETLADFGTVEYFGVITFTTGIYRTWFGLGEPAAAAQLAALLLGFVLVLLLLERTLGQRPATQPLTSRFQPLARYRLRGWRAAGASAFCALPVVLGFLLPAGILAVMTFSHEARLDAGFLTHLRNTVGVAGLTAVLTILTALVLAYGRRLRPSRLVRVATRVASMGYAVPGSVIAVGVLMHLGWIDNRLDAWMEATFGLSTGLLLSGTIAGLVFAYLVRFLAVAYGGVEANLAKITASMDDAARSLGRRSLGTLLRVHVPLLRGSLLTAALLVFVDVMKELPATLIVRPFNFDTLAVRVYRLASDERLAQAAPGALAIALVGLVPVVLLSWGIARGRTQTTGR